MAILLGIADVVLRQAQSPALVGGGDVLVRLGPRVPGRLVLAGTLQTDDLRPQIAVASPFDSRDLFLIRPGADPVRVAARGGIPRLERELGDPETSAIAAWTNATSDDAWTREGPAAMLREIDRFHPMPASTRWSRSWAEWLYFNGRNADARFYLTFLVGGRNPDGSRQAGVRLQLERNGVMETFGAPATLTEEDVGRAPDLTIGASSVRLAGMQYHIHLDLPGARGSRAQGDLVLHASPGRLVPPFEVSGSDGWVTGYVVPVMSGHLEGRLLVDGTEVRFDEGIGYHDHNWGFWEGVSWQWGQVQHEDLSLLYGRVFPPPEAADPERLGGFLGVIGPHGPIAYARDVRITETDEEPGGRPERIDIRAQGAGLDVTIRFDVTSAVSGSVSGGANLGDLALVQMRGQYTVSGRAGARRLDFTAPGATETFRGQ